MLRLIEAIVQRIKWGPKKEFRVWKSVRFDPDESRQFAGDHPFVTNTVAWSILRCLPFLHRQSVTYKLVKVTLDDLGQSKKRINNKKLLECAKYHGLLPCPPQLAIAIGTAVADEGPVNFTLATEPLFFERMGIRSGYGYFLAFKQEDDRVCLTASYDKGPTMAWFSNAEHVFVLPLR